jgi:hypothetical protein
MCKNLFGTFAALFLCLPTMSQAQEHAEIAGRWVCDKFCFIYDTGASIAIDGENAICIDERGDISKGHLLASRSVQCFGLDGQLTDDSQFIKWSNGNVWRRQNANTF